MADRIIACLGGVIACLGGVIAFGIIDKKQKPHRVYSMGSF